MIVFVVASAILRFFTLLQKTSVSDLMYWCTVSVLLAVIPYLWYDLHIIAATVPANHTFPWLYYLLVFAALFITSFLYFLFSYDTSISQRMSYYYKGFAIYAAILFIISQITGWAICEWFALFFFIAAQDVVTAFSVAVLVVRPKQS